MGFGNDQNLEGLEDVDLVEVFRCMVTIRAFEEKSVELYRRGELPGFLHPSVGQEAVAAGFVFELTEADLLISTHRGHGHLLAKGAEVSSMFAELYGRMDGLCKGLGGSMHIVDRIHGIIGANGIVGAGLPIACGAGLAQKLAGSGNVVVAFFGDGATNIGAFHEALNLSGLWSLPIVFVCENNGYGESTAFADVLPTADLMPRAMSYGMQFELVNGNDVIACMRAARRAVTRAREGQGPTLVQADTYRWYGHHVGDVAKYRTDHEVAKWKNERDPLSFLRAVLADSGYADDVDLENVVEEANRNVIDGAARAVTAQEPELVPAAEFVFGPAITLQGVCDGK